MNLVKLFSIIAILLALDRTLSQSLSSTCAQSLLAFVDATNSPSCRNAFLLSINNPAPCLEAAGVDKTINCLDITTVIAATSSHQPVTNPPRPLQNISSCSLCSRSDSSLPVNSSCASLLRSASEAAFGISLTDSYPNATSADLLMAIDMISANCSNSTDSILLSALRYQTEVMCASGASFGHPITPIGTLDGVLDMRHLLQCGTCGIMQCVSGMYCPGHSPALVCSKGYYCPHPAVRLI